MTTHTLPSPRLPAVPRLSSALRAATGALLHRQQPDGHWVGELEGDTILESEYVLLLAFLGQERSREHILELPKRALAQAHAAFSSLAVSTDCARSRSAQSSGNGGTFPSRSMSVGRAPMRARR